MAQYLRMFKKLKENWKKMEQQGRRREIIEPLNLHYSQLLSLSSPSSSSDDDEIQRLRSVTNAVMEALGPTGPGLLAITGVPNAAALRKTLLPLARDLALLPPHLRNRILKDHGLGSDVPLKNLDRPVSSFAMQLKYGDGLHLGELTSVTSDGPDKDDSKAETCAGDVFAECLDDHFKVLGGSFRELGSCMMDLGLRVAQICDRAIGGKELEKSLLESGSAKGRLIHYHSSLDTWIIKESARRRRSKKGCPNLKDDFLPDFENEKSSKKSDSFQGKATAGTCEKNSELWQQWHYDYGTLTVLTSPMLTGPEIRQDENGEYSCEKFGRVEYPSPSGHTFLQILHPNKDKICAVKAPSESFIVQVGESADILSKSRLRSTLHSVLRPIELESLSRETFVVFLHPAWNRVFDISDYPTDKQSLNGQRRAQGGRPQGDKEEGTKLEEDIYRTIPPLSCRLKDGMTFAEFARQTTKQYYGGNGLQANR